ncbi:MAG: hypothetical protein OXC40_01215 [Proteobacteria bacterium]|nr:hypothetical protein [Pseudomonadota bacterium]
MKKNLKKAAYGPEIGKLLEKEVKARVLSPQLLLPQEKVEELKRYCESKEEQPYVVRDSAIHNESIYETLYSEREDRPDFSQVPELDLLIDQSAKFCQSIWGDVTMRNFDFELPKKPHTGKKLFADVVLDNQMIFEMKYSSNYQERAEIQQNEISQITQLAYEIGSEGFGMLYYNLPRVSNMAPRIYFFCTQKFWDCVKDNIYRPVIRIVVRIVSVVDEDGNDLLMAS